MFNKPFDIVWIACIGGLIVITFGFLLQSSIDLQNISVAQDKLNFFNNATEYLNSGDFVKGTADDAGNALQPEEGAETVDSQDGILAQGFNSMLSLGQTYKASTAMMNEGGTILGIPPVYIITIMSAVIITLFIIIYTWIRGN